MSLTKNQRDVLLTAVIGGSVVLTIVGAILFMRLAQQPQESIAIEPPPSSSQTAPGPTLSSPVSVETEVATVGNPEPEVPQEPVFQLTQALKDELTELGVPKDAQSGVAMLIADGTYETWSKLTNDERTGYCVWTAGRSFANSSGDLKLAIGALIQRYLTNVYKEPGNRSSSTAELIALYVTLDRESIETEAPQLLAELKRQAADSLAREDGRVIKVQVLSKGTKENHGFIRARITNSGREVIPAASLKAEMTLQGKLVGHGFARVNKLAPEQSVVETIVTSEELLEGFDDHEITLDQADSHFALDIEK